ncbi:unnamed protein product [Ostreobium quekettii]|uniref:Uncharacterized protein n=1 Tax=Ostreobium quekettii TaxID=121088 RepID=A0A8S1IKM9_9CHLO|nr:unnamed protein product [Ostreobium quekettii]
MSGVGVLIPCIGEGWDLVCYAQPLWVNVDLDPCDFLGCLTKETPTPLNFDHSFYFPLRCCLKVGGRASWSFWHGWPGEYLCLLSFSCCRAPVGSQDMALDLDGGWWWRSAALESRTAILMLIQWYRILAGLMAVICHGSWARECDLDVVLRSHALQRFCGGNFWGFFELGHNRSVA